MKSEIFLTLHRQQRNWNFPRHRNVVRTSVKQSMWLQWFNRNLNFRIVVLSIMAEYWFGGEYFFNKVIILVVFVRKNYSHSFVLLSMESQKALGFHQKYLNLCSEDERRPYGFGTTWGWVINDIKKKIHITYNIFIHITFSCLTKRKNR